MKTIILGILTAVLLAVGFFILAGISPRAYFRHWADRAGKKSVQSSRRLRYSRKQTGPGRLLRFFTGARALLTQYGHEKQFPKLVMLALVFAVVSFLAALASGNLFLAPVLAIGLGLLPFAAIYSGERKRAERFNQAMKTALGVVTYTYIQTSDVIQAVEENISSMPQPFTGLFTDFLADSGPLGYPVPAAIRRMSEKCRDGIFREWCRVMIQCQDNHELRHVLPLVTDKIDETIAVQAETETALDREVFPFKIILAVDLLNLPLMALLEPDWFQTLMRLTGGQIAIAAAAAVTFWALFLYIWTRAPIRYHKGGET